MTMHHRQSNRSPMNRTQRACWLFLAFMRTSSGFTPHPSCPSSHQQAKTLSCPPPLRLVTEDDDGGSSKNRKSRGPLRAVRHILRRRKRAEEDSSTTASMHMLTRQAELEAASDRGDNTGFVEGLLLGDQVNADFILKNFQNTEPNDVFPSDEFQRRNVLTSEDMYSIAQGITHSPTDATSGPDSKERLKQRLGNDDDVHAKSSARNEKKKIVKIASPYKGGTLVHRMTRSWFQNFLTAIVHRRSKVPPVGLRVRVAPHALVQKLCRGQFSCHASIDFHRVVFQNIRLTGGSLEAKHMTLGVYGGGPRYASQFEIHANNCTFTQDDLFESSCIRNGLARLLVRILSNAGVKTSKVQVTAMDIVPSGKISCSGTADTAFGSKVSFEVRSGLGFQTRGHVVCFPGLEVSLGPSLGVFMPVVPDINLDIGHNARLRDVVIDGRRRRVTLSASTTVTPTHTVKLHKYIQDKDSYSSQFSFDVGRWVTNLGNFTN